MLCRAPGKPELRDASGNCSLYFTESYGARYPARSPVPRAKARAGWLLEDVYTFVKFVNTPLNTDGRPASVGANRPRRPGFRHVSDPSDPSWPRGRADAMRSAAWSGGRMTPWLTRGDEQSWRHRPDRRRGFVRASPCGTTSPLITTRHVPIPEETRTVSRT